MSAPDTYSANSLYCQHILYDGSQIFWRQRTSIDITIVEHRSESVASIIEVIAYDPLIREEANRIYLLVAEILAQTASFIAPRLAQEHERCVRCGSQIDDYEMYEHLANALKVDYILTRIRVISRNRNNVEKLRNLVDQNIDLNKWSVVLVPHFNDPKTDAGQLRALCAKPPSLVPAVIIRTEKGRRWDLVKKLLRTPSNKYVAPTKARATGAFVTDSVPPFNSPTAAMEITVDGAPSERKKALDKDETSSHHVQDMADVALQVMAMCSPCGSCRAKTCTPRHHDSIHDLIQAARDEVSNIAPSEKSTATATSNLSSPVVAANQETMVMNRLIPLRAHGHSPSHLSDQSTTDQHLPELSVSTPSPTRDHPTSSLHRSPSIHLEPLPSFAHLPAEGAEATMPSSRHPHTYAHVQGAYYVNQVLEHQRSYQQTLRRVSFNAGTPRHYETPLHSAHPHYSRSLPDVRDHIPAEFLRDDAGNIARRSFDGSTAPPGPTAAGSPPSASASHLPLTTLSPTKTSSAIASIEDNTEHLASLIERVRETSQY